MALFLLISALLGFAASQNLDLGYYTELDIINKMSELVAQYTAGNVQVTTLDVGATWADNITIKCLKIHLNEGIPSTSKGGIAYVGGLGAQPLTVNKVFHNVQYILSRIETDSGIKRALHFNDVYAIPMVNHDAYKDLTDNWVNRQAPYHQKNKQSNLATCDTDATKSGIDLYRNFPYQFEANTVATTCAEVYPGAATQDANEVQHLINFFADKRLALYESYIGSGTEIIKPYTWRGESLTDRDAYYFDAVVSQYGTPVTSPNTFLGSDIDYFQSLGALSMWLEIGTTSDWPDQPETKVDDYDDLLKHNLYHMTEFIVNPTVDFDDDDCSNNDTTCTAATSDSDPLSIMGFKFKVKNNGLTNSPPVQIKIDLDYDTLANGALYNLSVVGDIERRADIASISEWTESSGVFDSYSTDTGGAQGVSMIMSRNTLARRTEYEWTILIEKSKNLAVTDSLKDVSANLSIDFQVIGYDTATELTRYGAVLTDTVTISASALGGDSIEDLVDDIIEDIDDGDDSVKSSGGGSSDDDDGISPGGVVAVVVIFMLIFLVGLVFLIRFVINKYKGTSEDNYKGGQELEQRQPANIVPPQSGPGN